MPALHSAVTVDLQAWAPLGVHYLDRHSVLPSIRIKGDSACSAGWI